MQREDVWFNSGHDRISAWLYRPTGNAPCYLAREAISLSKPQKCYTVVIGGTLLACQPPARAIR